MNNITVDIFGDKYSIASDGDSDAIIRFAEYLDTKLQELKSVASNETKYKLSILCSLNIIEELFSQKKKISLIENNLSRITNLLNSFTEEKPKEKNIDQKGFYYFNN